MINALNKSLLLATFMHFLSTSWASVSTIEDDLQSQEENVSKSSIAPSQSLAIINVPQQKPSHPSTFPLAKHSRTLKIHNSEAFNPRPWYLKPFSTVRKLLAENQIRKSFIIQVKDLALPPAPQQQRPFLYKLTKGSQKFKLLGTDHIYHYSMMPSSVLRAVSKARRIIVEVSESDYNNDRPITHEELVKAGVIMDISSEVKRLVKIERDYWKTSYEQQISEKPFIFREEWKADYLQTLQAKKEQEITKFLSDWGKFLSKETQENTLELFKRTFPELKLNDINMLHPAAIFEFVKEEAQEEVREQDERELHGMDAYLKNFAQEAEKSLLGLDTHIGRYEASLAQFAKNRLLLKFSDIAFFSRQIPLFSLWSQGIKVHMLTSLNKQKLPSLDEDMKTSVFYEYHHGEFKEYIPYDTFTELIERNQQWFPKLEKYIQYNNTFVAVGLDHLFGPHGILEWAKSKGYTVKRSEN